MAMVLRSRFNYHHKLFLSLLIYSCLMLACFATFQFKREKTFKAEELNAKLQTLNAQLINDIYNKDTANFLKTIELHPFDDLRISVFTLKGEMTYDNLLDTLSTKNHLDREEIIKAVANGQGYSIQRLSESTGDQYFYAAQKGKNCIVRSAVNYDVSLLNILAADYGFLWFMVFVTISMCLVGFFVTKRMGQNISRLNEFAEKAERGEKIFDTEPFPHDELGKISNHIVRLYARTMQAMEDRDHERQVALQEEQEKNRIKRQLTNNINHELKTPVASMQICLETLVNHPELPDDKRNEFINRCYSSCERLRNLLNDVSTITRLDGGSNAINHESVNLRSAVKDLCDEYELLVKDKGMTLINHIDYDQPFDGNLSLINAIFRNLINNAINYSYGDTIILDQKLLSEHLLGITVEDNGVGVDPKHIPHLFERFYRLDKGRSRQMGGTGLGLSIVKNAVIWHGGKIYAENKNTGGMRFVFTFKV